MDITREQIAGPGVHGWLLLGEHHTELDEIAVRTLDGRCALALSRGKYPKGYGHVDPNEDAVLAVTDGERHLLAVADGHNGFDAARAAMLAVAGASGDLLAMPGRDSVGRAFRIAARAVDRALEHAHRDRRSSGTALTVAHVEGDRLHYGSMGDSLAVVAGRLVRTSGAGSGFLSHRSGPDAETASRRLRQGSRLGLVTDGVVDFMGREWKQRLGTLIRAEQPVETIAHALVEDAGRGGGGDNAAVVVFEA